MTPRIEAPGSPQLLTTGLHLTLGVGQDGTDSAIPTHVEYLNWKGAKCAAGEAHTVCVLLDRTVATFGKGMDGQLGHGDAASQTRPKIVGGLSNVMQCSAGSKHTICVLSDGHVVTFGSGAVGQLGHGAAFSQFSPRLVEGLDNVKQCEGGGLHTVCVLMDGHVTTFGYGKYGQLGHGDEGNQLSPKVVADLTNVTHCGAGPDHTACVLSSGRVSTFGRGNAGQLGHGDIADRPSPTLVAELTSFTHCVGGGAGTAKVGDKYAPYSHTACVRSDGRVVTFGRGDSGQLGHNASVDQLTPKVVDGLHGVTQCSAGGRANPSAAHTVCVLPDGRMAAFGAGANGQLGTGDSVNHMTPVVVSHLDGSVA